MKKSIVIYTLQLENGCFYVGKTINFANRLNQHLTGKGAEWTKFHRVIEVIDQIEFKLNSSKDEDKWENFVTIKLMKEKGWMNVRGGFGATRVNMKLLKDYNFQSTNNQLKVDERKGMFVLQYQIEIN